MITKAYAVDGLLQCYIALHSDDLLTELTMQQARAVIIEMLIDTVTDEAKFEPPPYASDQGEAADNSPADTAAATEAHG